MKPYPSEVCFDCGEKHGRGMSKDHICTTYPGTCGVCGKETTVTEPRDFGHLNEPWKDEQ